MQFEYGNTSKTAMVIFLRLCETAVVVFIPFATTYL